MSRSFHGGGGGGERKPIVCFSCGEQGHHIRDCPNKPGAGGQRGGQPGGGYMKGQPPMTMMGGPMPPGMPAPLGGGAEIRINLGHTSLDAQKRIKQLLIMMTPDEQSLTRMSLSLLEDIRLHQLNEFVCTTILHCVKCLPQKSMVFVGLLASLRIHQSRQSPEEADRFMNTFLEGVSTELQLACKHSRWDELRLLLRFASGLGLSGLVDMQQVWELIHKLQSFLQEPSLSSSKQEYLIYTLISLIPFLAEVHDTPAFTAFRTSLDTILSSRNGQCCSLLKLTSSSSSSSTSTSYATLPFSFDLIDSWTSALQSLRTRDAFMQDASEVSVQRASYQCFRAALEKVKPVTWHGVDHLALPNQNPVRLRPVLRLFPRPSSLQGFQLNDLLISDYIADLLVAFEALHKEGTKQLLSLPLPASDEARQIGQYLLIESIFENLFTLPRSPIKEVYYGTIFIDLFKAQPNLMPPLLGTAVNFLFHHLQDLDTDIIERLLDWFSFHLSNFAYVWPWISWNYVLEQSDSHPQRQFVKQALALCVRLSYWERIQQVLPEEFVVLMPHQPLPAFRFSTKNIQNSMGDLNIQQYYQFSLELISIIQGKSTPQAIVQWLDQNVTPALGSEARVRLFTPCLLECGNKSYSHSIALLERYKTVFHTLSTTTTKRRPQPKEGEMVDAATAAAENVPLPAFDIQRLILHSLSEYWQHSLQHIIVLLDQFFHFNIVTIQAVIGWAYFASPHPELQSHLWKPILYQLLRKALIKLDTEIETIRTKPKSMSLTPEKRAADEAELAGVILEQRDLLTLCISNFHKLLQQALTRKVTKEREKEKVNEDVKAIVQRTKQFIRMVSHTWSNARRCGREDTMSTVNDDDR